MHSWRRNPESVKRLVVTPRVVARVTLDPYLETADADLTNNTWLYGGSRQVVEQTITHGRHGVMPAWKDILGEDKVHLLASYVYSLSHQAQ